VFFAAIGYADGMLFSPRIGLKPLINLCRRLSTALESGIDMRTVWAKEAQRAVGPLRRRLTIVGEGVCRGESLADALEPTGEFFPLLFRELIDVGEQTGHLDAVLAQLAEHYQTRLSMRRTFLAAIAWPVIQLGIALIFIGLVIWLMGILREATGNSNLDIFGFGLVGNRGLAVYAAFLALAGAFVWLFVEGVRCGLFWTRPLQRLMLRLPGIGRPFRTMALSRLAWAMHLTMGVGMEVRRAMRLSFRAAQNAYYTDQIPAFEADIAAGCSIHETFCNLGGYPLDFLDTLAVGEESGKVSDSMAVLARQYTERARLATVALALAAGVVVWIAIAALIITLIFRIFITCYLGPINSYLPK